jgi:hypothetical protein
MHIWTIQGGIALWIKYDKNFDFSLEKNILPSTNAVQTICQNPFERGDFFDKLIIEDILQKLSTKSNTYERHGNIYSVW